MVIVCNPILFVYKLHYTPLRIHVTFHYCSFFNLFNWNTLENHRTHAIENSRRENIGISILRAEKHVILYKALPPYWLTYFHDQTSTNKTACLLSLRYFPCLLNTSLVLISLLWKDLYSALNGFKWTSEDV